MGKVVGLTFGARPQGEKSAEGYACPLCGKTYKTQESLKRHTAKEHPDDGMEKTPEA